MAQAFGNEGLRGVHQHQPPRYRGCRAGAIGPTLTLPHTATQHTCVFVTSSSGAVGPFTLLPRGARGDKTVLQQWHVAVAQALAHYPAAGSNGCFTSTGPTRPHRQPLQKQGPPLTPGRRTVRQNRHEMTTRYLLNFPQSSHRAVSATLSPCLGPRALMP